MLTIDWSPAHVAVLSFNDPARKNAMSPELGDALATAVAQVRERADVRAVVLTGAGGAFSAGGDLKMLDMLRSATFEDARKHMLAFYARYLSILDLKVPVIAAIEGPAIGAGLCVALACDLIVVAEDAKLALNFVTLGLHPGMGATYLAPRRLGAQRAADLLLTGRRFDGKEALALGLASRTAPPGKAVEVATAMAASIAGNAPMPVAALKLRLGVDRQELQRALEHEAVEQAKSYASADFAEGMAAAGQRRSPRFDGR